MKTTEDVKFVQAWYRGFRLLVNSYAVVKAFEINNGEDSELADNAYKHFSAQVQMFCEAFKEDRVTIIYEVDKTYLDKCWEDTGR